VIQSLVVYDSWYDNTKAAAQEIAKGLASGGDLAAIVPTSMPWIQRRSLSSRF